jgi:hypothetical protein
LRFKFTIIKIKHGINRNSRIIAIWHDFDRYNLIIARISRPRNIKAVINTTEQKVIERAEEGRKREKAGGKENQTR